jgi:mRNA interferase HigB
VRVIAIKALSQFWTQHRDAEDALRAWYAEATSAQWRTPQDIVDRYRSADILPGNRVVFNIKGNQYRPVVKIHYNTGVVYIRFVGTHAEYNRIDAEAV